MRNTCHPGGGGGGGGGGGESGTLIDLQCGCGVATTVGRTIAIGIGVDIGIGRERLLLLLLLLLEELGCDVKTRLLEGVRELLHPHEDGATASERAGVASLSPSLPALPLSFLQLLLPIIAIVVDDDDDDDDDVPLKSARTNDDQEGKIPGIGLVIWSYQSPKVVLRSVGIVGSQPRAPTSLSWFGFGFELIDYFFCFCFCFCFCFVLAVVPSSSSDWTLRSVGRSGRQAVA